MRVKVGVDETLEAEADSLLKTSLSGVTKQSDKRDLLTPWKAKNRADHEVLVGLADPTRFQGTFTRRYNPVHTSLNSREGVAGFSPRKPAPLSAYMAERSNVQNTGDGVQCNGFHGHYPSDCSRNCAASRRGAGAA